MRRKSLMEGKEGGCWKSGTLCAQLAGFLPYFKYGFEEQSGRVTSPADFNSIAAPPAVTRSVATINPHFRGLKH